MRTKTRTALAATGALSLLALALAGCGTASTNDSNSPVAAPGQQNAAASQPAGSLDAQTIYVFRGSEKVMGPDGSGHDAIVPSSWVVKKGEQVTLTIVNEDEGPHTLTFPDLDININIDGGQQNPDGSVTPKTTTATLTIPKTGVFRWYCAVPCDAGHGGWAMTKGWDGPDQPGYMAGYVVAI